MWLFALMAHDGFTNVRPEQWGVPLVLSLLYLVGFTANELCKDFAEYKRGIKAEKALEKAWKTFSEREGSDANVDGLFKHFDKGNDGYIDLPELEAGLKNLLDTSADAEALLEFMAADRDRKVSHRKISLEEFLKKAREGRIGKADSTDDGDGEDEQLAVGGSDAEPAADEENGSASASASAVIDQGAGDDAEKEETEEVGETGEATEALQLVVPKPSVFSPGDFPIALCCDSDLQRSDTAQ